MYSKDRLLTRLGIVVTSKPPASKEEKEQRKLARRMKRERRAQDAIREKQSGLWEAAALKDKERGEKAKAKRLGASKGKGWVSAVISCASANVLKVLQQN